MNIGIDGNEANAKRGVGINVYAFNVLNGLYKLNITGKHRYTIFLKEKPSSHMPKNNKFWNYKVLPAKKMWILSSLTPYLLTHSSDFDLFFTPSHYIPPFVSIKRVCAVMDLGYLENTEQFRVFDYWQLRLWTAYSISASKMVLTISAQSKKDIVRHYESAKKKTIITHLGYNNTMFHMEKSLTEIKRVQKKYNIVSDYVLFISTLKPSKNIDGLLKAWSIVIKNNKDIQLVIAGKKGWHYDNLFQLVEELDIKDRVVFTGFVDESDKEHLIKGATAFVLPSFWEGFGLDVVSAMASGVPVIISDRGSLPEVGGKAAIYVNPDLPKDIAKGLDQLLKLSKKDYNKLVAKGLSQADTFSWDKTAMKTLKALEEVTNN